MQTAPRLTAALPAVDFSITGDFDSPPSWSIVDADGNPSSSFSITVATDGLSGTLTANEDAPDSTAILRVVGIVGGEPQSGAATCEYDGNTITISFGQPHARP